MQVEMTPLQNARTYHRLLSARKAELLRELRSALGELAAEEKTEEDMAAIYHDQFVTQRMVNLDYTELKLVDAALYRLAAKTFGRCQECGCLISSRRLHAIPWAVRCLECEERDTRAAAMQTEEVFV